jgi:hypothetical protein
MSSERFFDYDPLTGITETFVETDNGFAIKHSQDVTPFIELNKAKQSSGKDYWRAGGDLRHEATIPMGVQYEWLTKYGVDVYNPDHTEGVVKLLNNPEWRYLKTAEIII